MHETITVGCDLHDKTLLLAIGTGDKEVVFRTWPNTRAKRQAMIADLRRRAEAVGARRIVVAYESSGLGFVLHDQLVAAGIACSVLAPSRIARCTKHRRRKTDRQDALRLLELLRAHVLAGNALPSIWIPDAQTREDREVVRTRLDVAAKISRIKSQIRCLLKRHGLEAGDAPGRPWTVAYGRWLAALQGRRLGAGASTALASLMRQLASLEEELTVMTAEVTALSKTPRYAPVVASVCRAKGVGVVTAMVFLTELGDLTRFANRRQVGSFLGLTPASYESGDADDRKGHITHQGPSRVRKVLNQAARSRIRTDPAAARWYAQAAGRNPKHKKIAVVGEMRRLAVQCWHHGREAQVALRQSSGPASAPRGADGSAPAQHGVVQESPRGRLRTFLADGRPGGPR